MYIHICIDEMLSKISIYVENMFCSNSVRQERKNGECVNDRRKQEKQS